MPAGLKLLVRLPGPQYGSAFGTEHRRRIDFVPWPYSFERLDHKSPLLRVVPKSRANAGAITKLDFLPQVDPSDHLWDYFVRDAQRVKCSFEIGVGLLSAD